jgi:hypothetical protein
MTQTRWYHSGATQRRNGKPCAPAPACKEWERRQWQQGWNDKDEALKVVDSPTPVA